MFLKQNTSVSVMLGPFVDETDGFTPEEGLTIGSGDVRISKADGAFAGCSDDPGFAHNDSGWYSGVLSIADTDTLGSLIVSVYVSGARPVDRKFTILPSMIYNVFVGGTESLTVVTSGLTTGALDQIVASGNAANWSGVADVSALATQTDVNNARDAVIATGMANWLTAVGFATSAQATTLQSTADSISGIVTLLPTIDTIVASGNAEGWNVDLVATGFATFDQLNDVSGLVNLLPTIDTIVSSGTAAGWADVTPTGGLATTADVVTALGIVIASGDANWSTATGFSTYSQAATIQSTADSISGYVDDLPTIGTIVSSGTAAGWAADTVNVNVTGLTPAALNQIVTSGVTSWATQAYLQTVPGLTVTGVFNEIIAGSLTMRTAISEAWSYTANEVDISGVLEGMQHIYKTPTSGVAFTLTATPSGRFRS